MRSRVNGVRRIDAPIAHAGDGPTITPRTRAQGRVANAALACGATTRYKPRATRAEPTKMNDLPAPRRVAICAALAAFVCVSFAACGGSSSETPPPLEPSPHAFTDAPLPAPSAAPTSGSTPFDDVEPTPKPVRETWSRPRARPHAGRGDAGAP
jgi:hypothetical protein